MYRGTGVSRGVRRTTWDRSLKNWELQIPCFEEFFWGGNTLGLVPASLPHTLGYACTFYAPTSPPPRKIRSKIRGKIRDELSFCNFSDLSSGMHQSVVQKRSEVFPQKGMSLRSSTPRQHSLNTSYRRGIVGGAEMTIIFSDNNSQILTAP